MKLNLIQVVYVNRTYKDKNGVERKRTMYFLETENHKKIAVQPSFKEGYTYFEAYADVQLDESEKKESK